MPIFVVVDANILISSPRLQTRAWKNLIEQRSNWNVQFIVPEVVLLEAVKNINEHWKEQRGLVNKLKVQVFGLDKQEWLDVIDAKINDNERELRDVLDGIDAQIVAPPAVDHMDLTRRSAEGRAPFSAKNKDCYRDALIWHTVLDTAQKNPDDQVWFVSDNTDDFGPAFKNWDGHGGGDRNGGPIVFHDDLIADLTQAGLDHVRYITNIHSLDQLLAAEFAPISSDTFRDLAGIEAISDRFQTSVVSHLLLPRAAALRPEDLTAIITAAVPDAETWEFVNGAQRGSDGWSARYTVTAVATFTTTNGDNGGLAVWNKKLIFSGDIAVDLDKSIADFTIESVTALHDDPNRALWPDPVKVRQETQDAIDSAASESNPMWQAASEVLRATDTLRGLNAATHSGILEHFRNNAAETIAATGLFQRFYDDAAELMRTSGAFQPMHDAAVETMRTAGAFQPADDAVIEAMPDPEEMRKAQKFAQQQLDRAGGASEVQKIAEEAWRRQRELGL
ncbi:PIN domain-containing protein [Nocardia asteroides]|uniref:PIN domain-containing protein n=1 Tax=Nocardia asteroides TaxID=1824 RepID=UPI003416245B